MPPGKARMIAKSRKTPAIVDGVCMTLKVHHSQGHFKFGVSYRRETDLHPGLEIAGPCAGPVLLVPAWPVHRARWPADGHPQRRHWAGIWADAAAVAGADSQQAVG